MKKGKYVLIILLIFIVLFLITAISFFYYEFKRPPAVKAHSYLELNLAGEIVERPMPNIFTMLSGIEPLSMYDIWMNIRKAKNDHRIKCLLLRLGYVYCNWAKINEIREAVLDFKKSGKKAYAYIQESMDSDKEYYLATACDEVILHPLGFLGINGIGGYVPFFKNTLAKLGIEAEFEHVEEYKTAPNMFTEDRFTPAHEQMIKSIYSDIFDHYLNTVAEARGKSVEDVKNLIDQGTFQGEKALESGLVDKLLFEDELQNILKSNGKKLSKISYDRYSKIKPSSLGLNRGEKIALIYGMGPIYVGESAPQTMGSSTVSSWIRRARKDKSVKAVVFRVDSPGGSAVGSDVIWREVVLTKKEKPVVVSMSDVAGSGGYWVSMSADKIVVQPQTLTGSIGVYAGKFSLSELYQKLGVTSERVAFGEKADLFSTFRGFTEEERKNLKKEILWIYDQFLTKVAQGRRMKKEEVDKIGKGRVWTGSQAKEIGLADEIGGLSRAIQMAKHLAGIPEEEEVKLVIWPKKISLFRALFGRKTVQANFPVDHRLQNILRTLQALEKERIWAVMPFWIHPE
jgi:protease-4